MANENVPTVGRVVYYKSRGSADGVFPSVDRAAIITQVNDDGTIGLAVLNPNGLYFNESVPQHKEGEVDFGVWDWMPYQKQQQAQNGDKPNVTGAAPSGVQVGQ